MTERIDAALDALADERAAIRDEHEAFSAFEGRIAELPTVTATSDPPLVADPQPSGRSLERVRTAYA
jgi:hypothetical protein